MTRRTGSKRTQLSRPDPAPVASLPRPVCHGIATPGDGTATVVCKCSREWPLPPSRAGGSPS